MILAFYFQRMEAAVCCNPLITTDQEFPLRSQLLLYVPINIKMSCCHAHQNPLKIIKDFSFFQSALLTVAIHMCLLDSLEYKITYTQ